MDFAKCSIYGIKHESATELVPEDENHKAGIVEFLRTLAICQGGVSEKVNDSTYRFQSQSPDEVALLNYAQQNAFVFVARNSDEVVITEKGFFFFFFNS